jgi:hypothetical protein
LVIWNKIVSQFKGDEEKEQTSGEPASELSGIFKDFAESKTIGELISKLKSYLEYMISDYYNNLKKLLDVAKRK